MTLVACHNCGHKSPIGAVCPQCQELPTVHPAEIPPSTTWAGADAWFTIRVFGMPCDMRVDRSGFRCRHWNPTDQTGCRFELIPADAFGNPRPVSWEEVEEHVRGHL